MITEAYRQYLIYIISLYGKYEKGMVKKIVEKLHPIEEESEIIKIVLEFFPGFKQHNKQERTKTLKNFIDAETEKELKRKQLEDDDVENLQNLLYTEKELTRMSSVPKFRKTKHKQNKIALIPDCRAYSVYHGSNGAATRGYLKSLEKQGQYGKIAAALFRAQKSSTRAKMYRGGKYTGMAYERKNEVIKQLCNLLNEDSCGLIWGWGYDENATMFYDVLYVELPQGQVSFHSEDRYVGPEYEDEWDGIEASEDRIILFCGSLETLTERKENV